jgi:hypothetical protein
VSFDTLRKSDATAQIEIEARGFLCSDRVTLTQTSANRLGGGCA